MLRLSGPTSSSPSSSLGGGLGGVWRVARVARRAMFHLANIGEGGWRDRHNETHTGSHQAPRIWRGGPPLEQKATQWPWRVDTEAHAVKCSFQLLVFMNISRSVQGILTSICNSKSMPVRQLMGKTSASLKRLPTFWLHLVFKSYAAAAELWLGQHERFNEVNCWGFNRRCDWVLRISSKNKEEKCQNLTGWIPV